MNLYFQALELKVWLCLLNGHGNDGWKDATIEGGLNWQCGDPWCIKKFLQTMERY